MFLIVATSRADMVPSSDVAEVEGIVTLDLGNDSVACQGTCSEDDLQPLPK